VKVDQVAGIALVAVGLLVFWECRGLPLGTLRNPGPAFMPVALGVILLGLGGLIALTGGASPGLRDLGWGEAGHAVTILAACGFAAFALERIGYRATMAVTVFFLLRVVERRATLLALTFSLGLALATFYLFETLLRVPLPRGPFAL
jgi:putative tricarboxylic transport membrane protein